MKVQIVSGFAPLTQESILAATRFFLFAIANPVDSGLERTL